MTTLSNKRSIEIDDKLPSNPLTFKDLANGNIFVDKTLLIADILSSGTNHYLITRPRKWGRRLILIC